MSASPLLTDVGHSCRVVRDPEAGLQVCGATPARPVVGQRGELLVMCPAHQALSEQGYEQVFLFEPRQ